MASALLQAECANILWKKVRRGEISAREGGIAARLLAGFVASFGLELCSPEPELARVLELSVALDHSAYDCVYLALAEARGIPLITADERLIRVVRAASQSDRFLDKISVLPLLNRPAAN